MVSVSRRECLLSLIRIRIDPGHWAELRKALQAVFDTEGTKEESGK
jgi:hypothetical protein